MLKQHNRQEGQGNKAKQKKVSRSVWEAVKTILKYTIHKSKIYVDIKLNYKNNQKKSTKKPVEKNKINSKITQFNRSQEMMNKE